MGIPSVIVDRGGLPVTVSENGLGRPIEISTNGLGVGITFIERGGAPVVSGAGSITLLPNAISPASPSADGQCWFHEPRALAAGGKLWFGTNGSDDNSKATGRATLYEVNEESRGVTRKDLATGTDWGDDHNYPVVCQRSDGRLVVFYCAHRLAAPIRYRVSVNVGTMVGGWSQEYTISVSATNPTYPSPVRLTAETNKFFLFFRNGVDAALSYLTSADLDTVTPATVDGGALGSEPTWSAEKQLTVGSGTQGIYTKVTSNNVDRIDILITDAVGDTSGAKNDIRHGYYVGGNWYTSLGVSLGSAATPIAFTDFTPVATSAAPDSFGDVWVWHIQNRPTTNLLVNESVFGSWSAGSATATNNVAANPLDGATTADRMTDTGGTQVHFLNFTAASFVSGRVYKYSVLAKYETGQWLQLILPNAAFGANAYANFDIQNGALGTVGSSATASIEAMAASGWYRISIRATATGTATAAGGVYAAASTSAGRASAFASTATRLLYKAVVEEVVIEAVFARFISTSDHRYYYARFNGLTWSKTEIDAGTGSGTPDTRSSAMTDGGGVAEGYYSPGLYLDTQTSGVVYCSVGDSSHSSLYRYTTTDKGTTWARQRVSGTTNENVRPFVPVNRTNQFAVLWSSGAYYFYDFGVTPSATLGYTTRVKAASLSYFAASSAPINVSVPTIAGSASTGNDLTASPGSWMGDIPLVFSYQWKRNGINIGGATSQTYSVVGGDAGHVLTVSVTATNGAGASSATSLGASAVTLNLIQYSEDMSQWTASATTRVANVANDPVNGQLTADRIAESANTAQHSINAPNITFTIGTTYTFSIYVKYESKQFLQLMYGSAPFGAQAYANFDIQAGTVASKGSSATSSIVDAGGGWLRLIMTATATATASGTAAIFGLSAGTDGRAPSYLGIASNTWIQSDAQVETGGVANTYVPT